MQIQYSSAFKPYHLKPSAIALAVFAALQLQPHDAAAQDAPKTEAKSEAKAEIKPVVKTDGKPTAQTIDKVEVKASASAYDARQDDTATKIVVNQEEIRKYGDTQIADVLKRVPGVTVTGNNDVRMRGLGNGYTQILVDGERPPPGFTLENVQPSLVERIEIIRAATAEFSTAAVAGTINIVMKKKVAFSQKEVRGTYASGANFRSQNVGFNISDSAGKFAFNVGGWVNNSKNTFPYRGEERAFDVANKAVYSRDTEFDAKGESLFSGLFSRVVYTYAGGDTLSWQGNFYGGKYRNKYDSKVAFLLGPPTDSASGTGRFDGGQIGIGNNFNYVAKLAEGAKLDLKFNTNFRDGDNDSENVSFNQTGVKTLDRTNLTPDKETQLGFIGKYTTPTFEGHSLAVGWDAGHNNAKQRPVTREAVIGVPNGAAFTTTNESANTKVARLAMYAQDEWNLQENWSVYLGLRWEGIETKVSGDTFAAAKNRLSVTSPIAQTLWKFPDKSGRQLRAALTSTYRPPAVNNLSPRTYKSVVNTSTSADSTGNPSLKPELANGLDIAYEHFTKTGASMSISGTIRNIRNYNTRETSLIDGRWVNRPVNKGTATSQSLEFDTRFPLKLLLDNAPPIDMRLNLARNFSKVSEVKGPDNRLDAQVPFNGTAGLDYRMTGGKIVAGASYTFRAGGDVQSSERERKYQSPKRDVEAYVLYNQTLSTPKERIQYRLTLSNILRQQSVSANTFVDSFGAVYRNEQRPSGLSVRAGVEYKF